MTPATQTPIPIAVQVAQIAAAVQAQRAVQEAYLERARENTRLSRERAAEGDRAQTMALSAMQASPARRWSAAQLAEVIAARLGRRTSTSEMGKSLHKLMQRGLVVKIDPDTGRLGVKWRLP
jgi:uncharacterized NAD(P)/FAD-binding protein YdhS